MKVDNRLAYITTHEAKKGKVYLAVTEDKKLYIIKQVGARSWGAFNMDVWQTLSISAAIERTLSMKCKKG